MAVFTRTETLLGERAAVWEVVGAVTGTDNDHLALQEIVAGDGVGMIRRCVDTDGHEWTETCTIWEPGRAYRFDVAVDEHPLPMKSMAATVEAGDSAGSPALTPVTIRFDYRSKLGPIVDQMAKPALRKIARENFATWRAALG